MSLPLSRESAAHRGGGENATARGSPRPTGSRAEDVPQFSLYPVFQHVSPQTVFISQMSSTRLINTNDVQPLLICSLFPVDSVPPFLFLFSPPLYAKVHQGPLASDGHSSEANGLPEPAWGVPWWPVLTFSLHWALRAWPTRAHADTHAPRYTTRKYSRQRHHPGFPYSRRPASSFQAGVPGLEGHCQPMPQWVTGGRGRGGVFGLGGRCQHMSEWVTGGHGGEPDNNQ